MTQQENWPKVAVVGAGAVGGYFGGLLARAGAPVVLIGRAAFVEAVKKNGLFLDTLQFQESVRVEASAELSAARGAARMDASRHGAARKQRRFTSTCGRKMLS